MSVRQKTMTRQMARGTFEQRQIKHQTATGRFWQMEFYRRTLRADSTLVIFFSRVSRRSRTSRRLSSSLKPIAVILAKSLISFWTSSNRWSMAACIPSKRLSKYSLVRSLIDFSVARSHAVSMWTKCSDLIGGSGRDRRLLGFQKGDAVVEAFNFRAVGLTVKLSVDVGDVVFDLRDINLDFTDRIGENFDLVFDDV